MKFGIIGLGSKSTMMILKEAENYFSVVKFMDIRKIEIKLNSKINILYNGKPIEKFDCLYLKGSYRYSTLLYALTELLKNETYIPIDSNAHIIAHNKFLTHLLYSQESDIKMPMTYYAPRITETKEFLKTLNYPIIMKFPSGTHGKGVIYTESYSSASSMIDALDIFKQPVLVQDYIEIKSDIRAIVAGDKVVACMRRKSQDLEIRANAHQGGTAVPYKPTTEIKKISINVAKKLKAEVCAVDLIESDYGPLVLEVNTSPGLQKITEVTKINVADEIVSFLYKKTKSLRSKKDKKTSNKVMNNLGISNIGESDFETELRIVNNKIVLPEFATNFSKFSNKDNVIFRIKENEIIIKKI